MTPLFLHSHTYKITMFTHTQRHTDTHTHVNILLPDRAIDAERSYTHKAGMIYIYIYTYTYTTIF
jgi:hypothetical protein